MKVRKNDIIETFEIVIVALACPFALFVPPFNNLTKKDKNNEQMETIQP